MSNSYASESDKNFKQETDIHEESQPSDLNQPSTTTQLPELILRPNKEPEPRTKRLHNHIEKELRENINSKPDEEQLYGDYIAAEMRNLSGRERSHFKIQIQQLLHQIKYPTEISF